MAEVEAKNEELLALSAAEGDGETAVEIPETVQRCLVFESAGLVMFLSTDYVIEIINDHTVTPIPNVPSYVKGVINLRGSILPVVDTGVMMGHAATDYTSKTCIIVLDIDNVQIGIIVDMVRQVVDIDMAQIQTQTTQNHKLSNGMLNLEDGTTAMSFDCQALIAD